MIENPKVKMIKKLIEIFWIKKILGKKIFRLKNF